MSSDVAMYDDELKALEDQVSDVIRAMDSVSSDQRLEKYNRAQDLLKRLNKTFHQFKVEVRMLDGSEQAVYEKKCQGHDSTISGLKSQLQAKRAEANQGGMGGGGAGSGGSPMTGGQRRGDGKDEARDVAQRISKTQDGTLAALKSAEKTVAETEDIGEDATLKLKKQTEQMKDIIEDLDELDSEVNRAKKELNAFIRRMMTDKIILCFAVMLIIGIIVIVVLRMKKTSPETQDPNQHPPATPTPPHMALHMMKSLAYNIVSPPPGIKTTLNDQN